MADADGERNVERGHATLGHASGAAARESRGRSALASGPPKFIKRRLVAHAAPRLLGARALASVAFWRSRASRDPNRAFLSVQTLRLDFYIQAFFPAVSPALLGLRTRHSRCARAFGGASTRLLTFWHRSNGAAFACLRSSSERGELMRTPAIRCLATVSLEEALAYLDAANGDELTAAFSLARDRNRLDGSSSAPDDAEVHQALFLLRKARGLDAPSFDLMRVQLRQRAAA